MKCPFCQGEISDSAVRCRHCQKSLLPTSFGQEAPAVRKPPEGAAPAPRPAAPAPEAPKAPEAPRAFGGLPPKNWNPDASPAPAAGAKADAAEPPRRTGFVGGPPKDWNPDGSAAPAAAPAAEPPKRTGFVGGPPKDWAPTESTGAVAGIPDPPRPAFGGGPPKDWKPAGADEPPRPAEAPVARAGFGGGPPKDWKPPEDDGPRRAAPAAEAAPARPGFGGGPPKDWKPDDEAPKKAAFGGGPPKDWKPDDEAPKKAAFGGGPPKDWKPGDEAPKKAAFGGGPPKDWKPEGGDGAAAAAGAAGDTLWSFAQTMPTDRDERIGDEAERQRQAQRQSILDDIRDRADGINRALEGELPEHVLKMAYELKEYICEIRRNDDPEIDAELDKVQAAIDQLEKAGYRVSGPMDGLRENALSISKSTMKWFAFAVIVVGLIGYGIYALIQSDAEANARMPGRLQGTVSIDRDGIPIRVGFENVRLVKVSDGSSVLASKLAAYHSSQQAFNELKTKRGGLPAEQEATTNTVGQFQFEKVPPGKYYVIVLTLKNEDQTGAWMVEVPIEATKITNVELGEVNRLK